jgi:tetratricopeptide (TPR) repeat protein
MAPIKEIRAMRFRGIRLRTLVIGIALLAISLLPLTLFSRVRAILDGFYGPGGVLARTNAARECSSAGDNALREGRYAAAESRYRQALALTESLPEPDGGRDTSAALLGLAEALAKQGLPDKAEPFYRGALNVRLKLRQKLRGTPFREQYPWDSWVHEVSRRYVSFLRMQGRLGEAEVLERSVEADLGREALCPPGGFAASSLVCAVIPVRCWSSVRCKSSPGNWVAPAGSYRLDGRGNETVGAFEKYGSLWRLGEPTGRNRQ